MCSNIGNSDVRLDLARVWGFFEGKSSPVNDNWACETRKQVSNSMSKLGYRHCVLYRQAGM
ncbi:hypothetical protein VCR3J2_240095 [Vibrio coralliirubri]|nr:hypothetical protein VCR29J2_400120 [Vibrio coralliirubri]CDT81044.1 hypothetical protein VCR3J2_240095 [Vibrio coralliirubri]